MTFEQITTELAENVLTITLNRPERLNARIQLARRDRAGYAQR
jgi:enoyl-CoA hydratase/carnithine racemase